MDRRYWMEISYRRMVMQTTNLKRALIGALFFLPFSTIADQANNSGTPESQSSELDIRPYQAEYKVFRGGSEYGKGSRSLLQVEDGLWYLETSTDVSWLFLSDRRQEKSWFKVFDDHVVPLQYKQKRSGTGPDYLSFVLFDHRLKKVKEIGDYDEFEAVYQPGVLDGASYQFQMMRDIQAGVKDITYPIIMSGENKEYRFKLIGEEELETPFGKLATVKLERIRGNKKRQTYVWLAKEYGYVVARIWQAKGGSEQADLQISHFKWLKQAPHPELKAALKVSAPPDKTK
ncbi:DUF3108 domain-containing protein [Corallincola spongiicola]|uniref:DUF3108 domain-containing protein n=2 Tax=Corallincola spongiicola TaxID=2520508 RepID=A0ABY1WVQ6_9GAMM|nr:DUF3108 domain-containing protein [Corallincola spongiicola]